eukprot:scaffold1224_cov288-Chaetoceros_neogracile.AAC.6
MSTFNFYRCAETVENLVPILFLVAIILKQAAGRDENRPSLMAYMVYILHIRRGRKEERTIARSEVEKELILLK